MTNSEQDVLAIRKWCGSDFPICFDVVIQDEEFGELITTEIAGGEKNYIEHQSYAVANNWDELLDMCKRGAMNRHGFRIVSVFNYQASHQIIYK